LFIRFRLTFRKINCNCIIEHFILINRNAWFFSINCWNLFCWNKVVENVIHNDWTRVIAMNEIVETKKSDEKKNVFWQLMLIAFDFVQRLITNALCERNIVVVAFCNYRNVMYSCKWNVNIENVSKTLSVNRFWVSLLTILNLIRIDVMINFDRITISSDEKEKSENIVKMIDNDKVEKYMIRLLEILKMNWKEICNSIKNQFDIIQEQTQRIEIKRAKNVYLIRKKKKMKNENKWHSWNTNLTIYRFIAWSKNLTQIQITKSTIFQNVYFRFIKIQKVWLKFESNLI
jgi:hypothetical protein